MDGSYLKKVDEQVAQYSEGYTTGTMALPPVYFYWSQRAVTPGFAEVFGTGSIPDFFANELLERRSWRWTVLPPRFLSIGCGDGGIEIDVARALKTRGLKRFILVCADISPESIARFQEKVPADLKEHLELVVADLNTINLAGMFDGVMANHSLHHIVELETVFNFVKTRLKARGRFAINDMIGRNGHMRWPETLELVEEYWPRLTYSQRYNVQLRRHEETYVNHDCSTFGFEGVRAQDILRLLLERFSPRGFFGFGGFIDVFVDRCFGPGLNPENESDRALLDEMIARNEQLLNQGIIKPTMMLASFQSEPCEERCFAGRAAKASIRTPLL